MYVLYLTSCAEILFFSSATLEVECSFACWQTIFSTSLWWEAFRDAMYSAVSSCILNRAREK